MHTLPTQPGCALSRTATHTTTPKRITKCRSHDAHAPIPLGSAVAVTSLTAAGATHAEGLDMQAVAASQAALQGVFKSAADALSAVDVPNVQNIVSKASVTLQADTQIAQQRLMEAQQQALAAVDTAAMQQALQATTQTVQQATQQASQQVSSVTASVMQQATQQASQASSVVQQATHDAVARGNELVQQLPGITAEVTTRVSGAVSQVEGRALQAYTAAQTEVLGLSDGLRDSLGRAAASLKAASSTYASEAEHLFQSFGSRFAGSADSVQHAVQTAGQRAMEVVREQPEAVTGAAVLAAVGGTLAVVGAQQRPQGDAAVVKRYEKQIAQVKAQADRAKDVAAQLQAERDAAQKALEKERSALVKMQQDAAAATRKYEQELMTLQGKEVSEQVRRALDQQRAQTEAAEQKVVALQSQMDEEQAKFAAFHKEALLALDLLQQEKTRSSKLQAANQELHVLLQQAALLQKQQEELMLQQKQQADSMADAESMAQLQLQIAELAEVNEKLRLELERAMLERIAAGPDSKEGGTQLIQQIQDLEKELDAERVVAQNAGAQAVQAKLNMEVVMAASAELMQKLEASQQREQGLQSALDKVDEKVKAAQQEAQKQRERNSALIKQVDSNAEQAMVAIKMLQQESQNIIAGQAAVIQSLTKERDEALLRLAEAEAKLEAERGAVQSLKGEVRAAKEALLTSFNDITSLQSELGVARESTAVIKTQVDGLTEQISSAERQLSTQVSHHLTAMQSVLRLRGEADGLRKELEATAKELMQQDVMTPELQQHVYLLREAYAVTVDRLEGEQMVASRVKKDVQRLKKELTELQERSSVLRAEMDLKEQVLTKVMLEASRQLGATEGRLREAEERLGRSNRQLALAQGELTEVGLQAEQGSPALRKQAAAVVSKLQNVINGVRQEMAVLQQETVRAQAELLSERQARLAAEEKLQACTAEFLEGIKSERSHRQTLEHRLRSLQHEYWAVKATLTAPQMQDAAQLMSATMPKKVRVSEKVLLSKQTPVMAGAEALLTPGPEDDMVQAMA